MDMYIYLQHIHGHLCYMLTFPHTHHIRNAILQFLISLQKCTDSIPSFPSQNDHNAKPNVFYHPFKSFKPSFTDQVTSKCSTAINPYLIALTKNCYHPISVGTMDNKMEEDAASSLESTTKAPAQSPKSPSRKRVTVEESLETITDITSEMEEDDPPIQMSSSQSENSVLQQAIQTKASSFTHQFSIYQCNGILTSNLKTSKQIALFQSFCKCLKSIDTQLQILPIHKDHNIHPLSTSDQITHIDEIDITNFFKAYKRTKCTLSGDFHITTCFPLLDNHKKFSTWFHLNGYNMTIGGCQSSKMVQIGFLSRVQGFTYHDYMHDLHKYRTMGQNKFHFRLYFDTLSSGTKGQKTYKSHTYSSPYIESLTL
jgi:hypothetical protein